MEQDATFRKIVNWIKKPENTTISVSVIKKLGQVQYPHALKIKEHLEKLGYIKKQVDGLAYDIVIGKTV